MEKKDEKAKEEKIKKQKIFSIEFRRVCVCACVCLTLSKIKIFFYDKQKGNPQKHLISYDFEICFYVSFTNRIPISLSIF